MRLFDWFRGDDDMYDTDDIADQVANDLTKMTLTLGKLDHRFDIALDAIRMTERDIDVIRAMLGWVLVIVIVALVVAGVGLGVALSIVWG